MGCAKSQLGADEEAVVWYRRGIDANRNFAGLHFFLASALALLGQLDEARAAVQQGLALDPTIPFVVSERACPATIQFISPDESACMRVCARQKCQRGKTRTGRMSSMTELGH
ncbi:MAG: tetratricopeptide repeat protein [Xanthobacteraceae bacterium]